MRSATGYARWAGIACVLVCGLAHADRVAVLPPKLTGGASTLRDGLRTSLEGAVAAAGHEAVATERIASVMASSPAMAACDTEICLRRLGELASAQAVLRTVVEVLGSSNYNFHLELVDVHGGKPAITVDDVCSICTIREANEELSSAASTLVRRRPHAPEPAPAVALALPAAEPPRHRHYTPRGRAFLGAGITSLILGTGLIDAGAALVLVNGRKEGSASVNPTTGVIEQNHIAGTVPGAILVSAGGLVLIGGSVLMWRAALARHD
jgi:hypothetical protein